MKYPVLARLLVVIWALGLFGCREAATSNHSGGAVGDTAPSASRTKALDPAALSSSSGPVSALSSLQSVFEPKPILVKPGTEIVVKANQEVSSRTNSSGDQFEASLAEPVIVGDRVVIPKGAPASGTVVDVKSGRFKESAELTVALDSVTVRGKSYRVKASEVTWADKGYGKRAAEGAGGDGGGTGAAALTGQLDITISSESKLSFKLENAVEIERR
jgi:hypothetical protein